MSGFSDAVKEDIAAAKSDGTRFFGLTIANSANKKVTNEFDENWIYDPRRPEATVELVRNMAQMRARQAP